MVNMFTGQGRIGRLEYFLTNVAVSIVVYGLMAIISLSAEQDALGQPVVSPGAGLTLLAAVLVGAVISWSAIARRLHDRGHSGWMVLLMFVPLVGFALGLYLLFASGDKGINPYGAGAGSSSRMSKSDQMAHTQAIMMQAQVAEERRQAQYTNADGSFDTEALFRQ